MKKIPNWWFSLPIVILAINLIVRIIDQSKLLYIYPLDFTNDLSSYMGRLFFLTKCGFHNFCPYWYNGFISFKNFSLGWSLFTLPLFWLTDSIIAATFISIILMYLVSFIFLYILGKTQRLSLMAIIAFFFFFFGNAITVGNFLRLGRTVSMWGFVLVIGLASLVLYYKNHPLDKKFSLYFIPLYAIILFSHQPEMLFSQILVLGLFLVKKTKEKVQIVASAIAGFLLASFWVIPFLQESLKVSMFEWIDRSIEWPSAGPFFLTNLAGIIIPLVLFGSFYFYWKTHNKSKKELLFFAPILLTGMLSLFGLTKFLYLFRNISPDPYLTFFIFIIIFYFLKTKFENVRMRNLAFVLVSIVCIVSVVITQVHTPLFTEHGPLEKEVISIFPFVEGKYTMISDKNVTSYSKAYYTYAAVYHNLSTAGGWYPHMASKDYLEEYNSMFSFYNKKDCKNFTEKLNRLNIDEVIFYGTECGAINTCGLKEKKILDNVCLYEVS